MSEFNEPSAMQAQVYWATARIAELETGLRRARDMLGAVLGDIEDGYGLADLRGKYVIALLNARDDATETLRGPPA